MNPRKSASHASADPGANPGLSRPAVYEIVLGAYLDDHWQRWFPGMTMTGDLDQRTTTLAGRVADQAALHGLLAQIRDLGLPLLSITFVRLETGGVG